jgi:hypothetical protein
MPGTSASPTELSPGTPGRFRWFQRPAWTNCAPRSGWLIRPEKQTGHRSLRLRIMRRAPRVCAKTPSLNICENLGIPMQHEDSGALCMTGDLTPYAGLSLAMASARTKSGCGRRCAGHQLRRMTCRRRNTRSRRARPTGKITNSLTGDFISPRVCVIDVVVSRRSEPAGCFAAYGGLGQSWG